MDPVNLRSAISNLTQMDRVQSDIHKLPVTNAQQNADMARNQSVLHMMRPNAVTGVDPKRIEPNDRKPEEHGVKKRQDRRQGRGKDEGGGGGKERKNPRGGGNFVDVTA